MTAADMSKLKQPKENENGSTSVCVEVATCSEQVQSKLKYIRRWSRSDFGYDSDSDTSNSSKGDSSYQRINSFRRENPELLTEYKRFIQTEDITLLRVITYVNCVDICDEIISNLSFDETTSDEDVDENQNIDDKKSK